MRKIALLFLVLTLGLGAALAVEPEERLADPALEARARDISRELRCLVCQNQSIDDSDAELAADLRHIVRERLKAGDDNTQVLDYIVERYGEFVLMKPRLSPYTWALWATPIGILLIGGAGIVLLFRNRTQANRPSPLSLEEEERLKSLLKEAD